MSVQSIDDSQSSDGVSSPTAPGDPRRLARSPQIATVLVDVSADSAVDSNSAPTVASLAGGTVSSMTTNGLSLKYQSDTLVANIRGRHERSVASPNAPRVELARILPLTAPVPVLDLAPVTRAIGDSGRIRVAIHGQPLETLLGWDRGPLSVEIHGPWVLLQPDQSSRTRRRNDGRCAYLDDQRLRITAAVCANLGLCFGDEVALLALRAHGVLALTNPSRLLLGAPLALAAPATSTRELVGQ